MLLNLQYCKIAQAFLENEFVVGIWLGRFNKEFQFQINFLTIS